MSQQGSSVRISRAVNWPVLMKKQTYPAAYMVVGAILFAAGIVLSIAWERAFRARTEPPPWVTILFFLVFVPGSLLSQAQVAHDNGWTALAARYRARIRPKGRSLGQQVTRFGKISEGGITRIIVAEEGLFLYAMPLFRFQRPPLLIPWREVSYRVKASDFHDHRRAGHHRPSNEVHRNLTGEADR
jgi:hypothetical protein